MVELFDGPATVRLPTIPCGRVPRMEVIAPARKQYNWREMLVQELGLIRQRGSHQVAAGESEGGIDINGACEARAFQFYN